MINIQFFKKIEVKKIFISSVSILLALVSLGIISCKEGKNPEIDKLQQKVDSLSQENARKDGDINEMKSFVGVLADGLDSIAVHEEMLFYTNKGREGTIVDREQLKKNLEMFENMLSNQKQQIAQLTNSLKEKGDSVSKLATLVKLLNKQLDEKDEYIKSLRAELDKKNVNIAQLQKHILSLKESNTKLTDKVERQVDALKTQTEMINEGFVKVASKKELTKLGLLSGGFLKKIKVNYDAIQKDMFLKVDIRTFTEITIESSNPKILTQMPVSSYRLEKGKNTSTLYIIDPTAFWSVSNYLIIQTK